MPGTRFQFSILTMLVCTAALAVATAACVSAPVRVKFMTDYAFPMGTTYDDLLLPPTGSEAVVRMAWAGPLAVFVALCLLWASRRFVNFMRGINCRRSAEINRARRGEPQVCYYHSYVSLPIQLREGD
jgi:hypothetical protein